MPPGYWRGAWAVIWQSTAINAVILIGSNWLLLPASGYSFLVPILAPVSMAALAGASILVGTLLGFVAHWLSAELSIWTAFFGFAFVYAFYCLNWKANYQGDIARGMDGFQFVLAVIAIALWWLRIARPLKGQSA